MIDIKQQFINLIQIRSNENAESLKDDFEKNRIGKCLSTIREELDSFIRVIYLGRISDINERERLMNQTLAGNKWTVITVNSKSRQITDREMVEKSSELKGYIYFVYKFGCGFIHLSNFHDYQTKNPFDKLDFSEQLDIKIYLHQYHGFPRNRDLTVKNISPLILNIFEKISSNLAYYFNPILNEEMIEM